MSVSPRWPLQRVVLAAPPEVRPLYLRVLRGVAVVDDGDASVTLEAGGTVSGDTYFGSFPTEVWSEVTGAAVTLDLDLDGPAEVRVLHRGVNERYRLLTRLDHLGGALVVPIDPADAAAKGRLAFEIEAHGRIVLRHACWSTDAAPRTDVRLGVVLCTFNRLPYLKRTIDTLVDQVHDEALASIVVVNQGDSFGRDDLAAPGSRADTLLTLIEQDNLGGCGGFSRGLYELSTRDDLTHFLLLDDDIVLEAESVHRTLRLLSRATAGVAVGGHMLNLHRPLMLHEAGGRIHPGSAEHHPLASGVEVDAVEGLDELLDLQRPDYNAWWYFAGPTSILRHHLPMPCFIRGDDIEFGVRIGRAGVPTVVMAGIAVWHEPFYLKRGGWHLYFDVVNRLALAALHGIGSTNAVRRDLFWLFSDLLATSEYDQAALVITAIEDFNAGPDHVLRTDPDRMQRCRTIIDEFGPEVVAAPIGAAPAPARVRPGTKVVATGPTWGRSRKLRRLAEGVVHARTTRDVPVFEATDYQKAALAAAPVYDVRDPSGTSSRRYRRNASTERRLWVRFTTASRNLSVSTAWAEPVADDLVDGWRRHWHDRFAKAEVGDG